MRRILTLCLTFHWTVAFSLLSFFTIRAVGPDGWLAADVHNFPLIGAIAPALLAIVLSLVAALFLWAFLCALAERRRAPEAGGEDALRLAFIAAVCAMTLLLVGLAVIPAPGQLSTAALYFAALVASYLVIAVERSKGSEAAPAPDVVSNTMPSMRAAQSAIIYPFPRKEPR